MKTIYKYDLEIVDYQQINMPVGAQILCVQFQYGALCIWALVDTELPKSWRQIIIVGTGNPMTRLPCEYISTVQQHGGALVWHLFDAGYA